MRLSVPLKPTGVLIKGGTGNEKMGNEKMGSEKMGNGEMG
jgi:hypothetical protein